MKDITGYHKELLNSLTTGIRDLKRNVLDPNYKDNLSISADIQILRDQLTQLERSLPNPLTTHEKK